MWGPEQSLLAWIPEVRCSGGEFKHRPRRPLEYRTELDRPLPQPNDGYHRKLQPLGRTRGKHIHLLGLWVQIAAAYEAGGQANPGQLRGRLVSQGVGGGLHCRGVGLPAEASGRAADELRRLLPQLDVAGVV